MNSINKHCICGRLGKDPEFKQLEGGKAVCSFSMATSEVWKDDKGEKKERTEWHNITAWGKQAEIISKYVHKGDLLYIEGKARTRSYDDKEGNKRYVHDTHVDDFMLMPNGRSENNAKAPAPAAKSKSEPAPTQTPISDDDLPF